MRAILPETARFMKMVLEWGKAKPQAPTKCRAKACAEWHKTKVVQKRRRRNKIARLARRVNRGQ